MSEKAISDALKMIPYGFCAVTSRDGGDRNVMVLNLFSQVSFEPQHVVIDLQNSSYSFGLIEKSKKFVVNVFNKEEAEAIKPFTKSREKNPDKFKSANFSDAPDSASALVESRSLSGEKGGLLPKGHASKFDGAAMRFTYRRMICSDSLMGICMQKISRHGVM